MDESGEPARLGVVLVNFNGTEKTLACLESLRSGAHPPARTVVVDNGSRSDELQRLRTAVALHSDIVVNATGRNLGFGAAANVGLEDLAGSSLDGVLVLNNDALVEPLCLAALAASMRRNPTSVIVPVVADPTTGKVWYAGGHTRSPVFRAVHHGYGDPVAAWAGRTDFSVSGGYFICGCAFLVPETLLGSVRFNPSIFLYWEDVELSVHLRRRGVPLLVCPAALVWHREGASTGFDAVGELRRDLFKGHARVALACSARTSAWGRVTTAIATPVWMAWEVRPPRSAVRKRRVAVELRRSTARFAMLWRGLIRGIRGVPGDGLAEVTISPRLARLAGGPPLKEHP